MKETIIEPPDWKAAAGVVQAIHARRRVDESPLHPCIKFFERLAGLTLKQFQALEETLLERLRAAAVQFKKKLRRDDCLLSFIREQLGNLRKIRDIEFGRRERTLTFLNTLADMA